MPSPSTAADGAAGCGRPPARGRVRMDADARTTFGTEWRPARVG
ncbi:hypothetical protein [Candidatus Frankia alpina]|nr:hypothetical protein [Candidatus Frankia alpina]